MLAYIQSTSWKTTAAGLAAFCAAVGDVAHQAATGEWDGNRLLTDAGVIAGGVGLLFSKDHDKAGTVAK